MAFGCVSGAYARGGDHNPVEFGWDGAYEMAEACGKGWAELQDDSSLAGEIRFHNGDESWFVARRWETAAITSYKSGLRRIAVS